MNDVVSEQPADTGMAKIVYVLYLASILVGVTVLVGLVLAYVYKDQAPQWLQTHYQYQIRTFWIMVLYAVISGVLLFVLIGFLLYFLLLIWWVVRCVKGLSALDRKVACPNPTGWGF